MRPIHLSDLHIAACALRGLSADDQAATIARALSHADIADRYRKRLRKAHPDYGTGTLTSALGTHPVPSARPDRAYLLAMHAVITGILQRAERTIS